MQDILEQLNKDLGHIVKFYSGDDFRFQQSPEVKQLKDGESPEWLKVFLNKTGGIFDGT